MNEFSEFFDLLLPWREATDDQISDVFVYIIGGTFLLFGLYFFVRTFIQCRVINSLTKEVSKYGGTAKPRHLGELQGRFDSKGNPTVIEKLSGKVKLQEAWQEFRNSLVEPDNKEIVFKTDEASLFFCEERLLGQYINLRFWNSVPALFVGFGILGTFIGLVWGLKSFSDFDSTQAIREAIKTLLSGVSTAFVTSVWGMVTSLLFNILEKWRIGRASGAIENLQRALDQLFTLTRQEQISIRQEDELKQQTAAFKSVATDFATAIDFKLGQRFDDLRAAVVSLGADVVSIKDEMTQGQTEIIRTIDNVPNAIGKQLELPLKELSEAVEKLREQKEESSTEAIEKLIAQFKDSLSESTVKQMEELAKMMGNASKELLELPDKIEKMMNDMINGIKDTIDKQKEAIEGVTERTQTASVDATLQITNSAGELVNSVKDAKTIITELLQQQQDQIDAVNSQINNSQGTLEKGRELLDEMEKSVASVHKLLSQSESVSALLTKGSDQITEAGKNLTNASNLFNKENKEYLAANRETIQRLQGTLNDAVEKFPEIRDGLQGIFAEIQQGLQEYTSTTHDSILESLNTFPAHLTNAANALAGSIEALRELVEELSDSIEELRRR